MATIGWNENAPANTDPAGSGDDEIRSLKSNLRGGLDTEHLWPSAGGDAGKHRYGSARPYLGPSSQVSSDGTDGRLMLSSDNTVLYSLSATSAYAVGGFGALLASGVSYGPTLGSKMLVQMGSGYTTPTSGTTRVTFPSAYSGVPFIMVTSNLNSFIAGRFQTGSNATGFTAFGTDSAGVGAAITFDWISIGTVATGQP